MLYMLNKFFNTTDRKFIPKSLTIICGYPKVANAFDNLFAIAGAVAFSNG